MWLLNTAKLTLEYFNETQVQKISYAVLSHAWGPDEVLFYEVQGNRAAIRRKAGWVKTVRFCEEAFARGYLHAWIDTCCIDKRNSADLSEAINSMYRYYHDSALCIIYLEDVHMYNKEADYSLPTPEPITRDELLARIRATRWLTRGWTLQELIAPARRSFFASDWSEIEDGDDLLDTIAESAQLSKRILEDRDLLRRFSIGERMKWASTRQTTREEDIAYCLAGIFDVSIPVLYGEGARNAFRRLQLEIMRTSFDMTIFAWRGDYDSSGLLARSPADFRDGPPSVLGPPEMIAPYAMTNAGLTICLGFDIKEGADGRKTGEHASGKHFPAALSCEVQAPSGQWEVPLVYLEPILGMSPLINGQKRRAYRRVRCAEWLTLSYQQIKDYTYEDIIVMEDENYDFIRRARERHKWHLARIERSNNGSWKT
ncbi:heterokaryon incompatibility protein-domain-containing protein [Daldinia bambusicola]|nr:heterokaryon incompatibility protein-domain-containing protein [Daldinia bambusicola]